MFENANVLVTGGSGFIGSNLILRLLKLGSRVIPTYHDALPVVLDEYPYHHDTRGYLCADLTSKEDCKRVFSSANIDYVFMCAANTSGASVMVNNPLAHVTPNVVMNAYMLEAAHEANVKKFIFISSSAAYPESGDRPVQEDEMLEGNPPEVYYSVGWMKRYAEILCKTYSQKINNPMPCVVVRPSNMYGPYDKFDPERSHVTASLIRKVVERDNPIVVWGTGDDVRDLLYIDDFIDGLLLAAEKIDSNNGGNISVNIASGRGYSVKDILQTILEVDGYIGADVIYDPSKPSTIPIRLIDTRRAERLGFTAKTSLFDGIEKTVQWYRENIT